MGHNLEAYEIKILVDAISSSEFITKKKTDKLIDKVFSLKSVYINKYFNRKFL